MNAIYRDLITSRVRAAMDMARAAGSIADPNLKGDLREILIRHLFRPLFPVDIGLGTGAIIGAHGEHSRQQDIIVYDTRILPPLLLEQTGLFPVESVLYTIEVKSILTKSELVSAHESAKGLMAFRYVLFDRQGHTIPQGIARLNSTLLALDSDLAAGGTTEAERYRTLHGVDPLPPLRAICVVGRGYWYWNQGKSAWEQWSGDYLLAEVVGFISGIMNTYRTIMTTRESARLGAYLE